MKLSDVDFEKKVFMILREMGIAPKGFYRYQDYSDLIGQQKPTWPLVNALKVMVEILSVKLNEEILNGFVKSCKDNQVARSIVFGVEDVEEIDQQLLQLMKGNNIDYFGPTQIGKLIQEKSINAENIQEYQKASEIVAPKRLVDALDDLAHQIIPEDISHNLKTLLNDDLPAWNIFEEAVCAAFKYCIGYEVRQLGKEALFQEEPEGVAIIQNDIRTAFLFECKSSTSNYKMTIDHQRAYVDYIKNKQKEIEVLDHARLRYFVIVGPDFTGNTEQRRNKIYEETGVLLIFLNASTLAKIAKWACDIDSQVKNLIDLGKIFSIVKDVIVTDKSASEFIKNFDQKYKDRY